MVKKLHKSSTADSGQTAGSSRKKPLADNVMASAQQIWLAGMGAFGRAQAEGGKVFETLIKEGLNLQRKTQGLAEDKIQDVTGKMTSMAGEVQSRAGQHWDKLESIFEQRTAKAMAKLGVPTAKDVEALIQRVDELAAAVARLSAGSAAVKAPTRQAAPKASSTTSTSKPRAAAKRAAPVKAPSTRRRADK
jgi:poly(hydroxyalkanoate) granule-associated protein